MKKYLWISAIVVALSMFAAASDQIIGIDGNNLLIDSTGRKWNAVINYTTDGFGNAIPIGGSSVTIGTVAQGASGSFPWQVDVQTIVGSAPGASNALPARISNGTSFVDPTQIRALQAGVDSVTMDGGNPTAVKVDGSSVTQPVSAASLPLPSGAATSANQTSANASLASLDLKVPAMGQSIMSASLPVVIASDQSAVPVSVSSLPLPSGAATESSLSALNAKITTSLLGVKVDGSSVTQPISAASLPLPSGAATESTLSSVDGKLTTTINGLKTDGSGVTQPVSGTITANQGGAPWSQNITQVLGSAASASNGMPARITNGTSYVDPTQIRTLTTTDQVTARIQDSAGSSVTVGQKAMAASLPVTLSSDQPPVSVSMAIQDSSGSITSTQSVSMAFGSNAGVAVEISGTWTGTLLFEGMVNSVWQAVDVFTDATNGEVVVTSATANGNYTFTNLSGYSQVRVRGASVATGSATVAIHANETAFSYPTYIGDNGGNVPSYGVMSAGTDGTNLRFIAVKNSIPAATDYAQVTRAIGNAQYNSSMPSLTSGNLGTAQLNQFGELASRPRNKYQNITGATTVTVKSGAGVLGVICFNNGTATTTVTIYDNTSGSGTKIGTVVVGATSLYGTCHNWDAEFSTGLTIVTTVASTDITILYQ